MAKMGRPKIDNPKSSQLVIRVTPDKRTEIEKYSSDHDQTMTQTLVSAFDYMIAHQQGS